MSESRPAVPGVILSILAAAILAAGPSHAAEAKPAPGRPEAVIGHGEPLVIVPDLSEAVEVGNERIWSRVVTVKGASFLKLHLVGVDLAPGDRLDVLSPSGRLVDRIEGRGPRDRGTFWTLSVFDETLVLELHTTRRYPDRPPFRVDMALVGDPEALEVMTGGRSICDPPDFQDAICFQNDAGKWHNVMASVGVMTAGGDPVSGLWCSGANVSPLNYVMTNQHCIEDQAKCENSEFVFNHYRTVCGDSSSALSEPVSFRCDQLVAVQPFDDCEPTTATLDFALSSVIGDPTSQFGYVEPDPAALTSGEAIYIVQHPSGRPHEITEGDGANVVVDGHTLRYYDTLDTEPGSSGSPIFRTADNRMVGLHHCGGCDTAGTGNRGMLMADIYPEIEQYLCTADLSLRASSWSDLQEVEGNGDAVMDPGETWSFLPAVRNAACSQDATAVAADIVLSTASAGNATIGGTPVQFGDVPASSGAPAAAPVTVAIAADFPCEGELVLDLENLTASNGGPFDDVPGYFRHAVGEVVHTTLLFEDFSGGIPSDWTVVDGGTQPDPPTQPTTWTTDATDNSGSVGLTAPFAIADSDGLGSGYTMDEQLITPEVDCTGYQTVELQFAHVFKYYSGGGAEVGDVDVRSSATGGAWVNVVSYSGASASGTVRLDITAQAAGQTDVQVRFHYHDASYDWYWAVDDIEVLGDNGAVCNPWNPAPAAAIDGPVRVCAGTPVTFTDASTGATSWAWDFDGDGTVDSTDQNPPAHTYTTPGTYTCRLTASNGHGSDTAEITVTVIGATSAVAGDADGDGAFDARDLAAAIAELADGDGQATADRCGDFATTDRVDADGDGTIEVEDLTGLLPGLFG